VVLAKQFGIRARTLHDFEHAQFVPFTARTRMSGIDLNGKQYRKGAADAIREYVGGSLSPEVNSILEKLGAQGATPLVVAGSDKVLASSTQRHRKRRSARQVRALSRYGHPLHHDHGGQCSDAAAIAKEAAWTTFWPRPSPR